MRRTLEEMAVGVKMLAEGTADAIDGVLSVAYSWRYELLLAALICAIIVL